MEDLTDILAAEPDVLVIGYYGRMWVPEDTRRDLETRGIEVPAARTGDAVEEFNRLQSKYARVVAALYLTC